MAALSDQFLAVDVLFSHGLLDIAEEAYAQILKHAVEMDDKPLEVAALKAIGDVYLHKSRISKDGKDFTKASALYNAALVRCADWDGRQSLVHRIKRTEKCFLRYVVGIRNSVASTRKEDINRKLQLAKIRYRCKEKLQTLSSQKYHSYECEDNPMESEEARNAERRRTEAVRSMYRYVAVKMKQFIADMVEECIKTLGTVPCQYAMVGMGSICKEEMTPYSDLEFAILVEKEKCTDENKTYFRTLTHLLHLKVLNLGETILPSMAIKSLNDFDNKKNDWYYDNTTPHGFSFDGSMPWASKTALGRDPTASKPALELIMTPSEMAELQKDERSVKEGYHLADVLCNVTLISGEKTLVETYRSRVQELLHLPSQVRLGLTVSAERALASLGGFSIARECILKQFSYLGDPVNVKKALYRLGSLLVESLGLLFNCIGESVDNTLRNLLRIDALTPEGYHNLSTIVAIMDELRLHTYFANRAQRGLLGYNWTLHDPSVYSTYAGKHHVIWRRLFYTLIPLHDCLNKFLTAVDKAVHVSVITSLAGKVDMSELLRNLTDISRSAFNKDTYRANLVTASIVTLLLSDLVPSYYYLLQEDVQPVIPTVNLAKYGLNKNKMPPCDFKWFRTTFLTNFLGFFYKTEHQLKHVSNTPLTLGLGDHIVTSVYCSHATNFYCARDMRLAREMLDRAINEDKSRMHSNHPPGHMRWASPERCAVTIGKLSAALGNHTTAVKYLEEDLQLKLSSNDREYRRENEMTTRFQLCQSYTELSMPEEAERHRLGWVNGLHPLLSEAILMLQTTTSLDDVQCHAVEEGMQTFAKAVEADKYVLPWDIAVYVLNYSALLESQMRHVEIGRLFETAMDELEQCKLENDFDTKVYPRMVTLQAACLFYMRQGNVEKCLKCLQTVLKYSTYIFNDDEVNVYTDQASMNQIGFCSAVLNLQHGIGYSEEVKKIVLADIDRIFSIILFRATTFGPALVETCADCLFASGMTLANIGETLAAVEMFHVGLKICTSHQSFARALVFLVSMFRARRLL
uniref:Protein-PII uridylyltransferase N-terminal domain-containing protein n=1 Tax=Branchiostoma floridae TaxID=7739 RepID=C3XRF9_BRAFL|eukprot:XP_002613268.1 hypothetical protein BRAFLDRAFT_68233 [Branchiostoma floridae]